ncbi:MAG: single-stranded-DNA-specific exonuclease RecJ [Chloroflexi bacterium]|nr:single-stranded-DNA-specific exonuclease RecJ [Chloroflexota bacterium]
MEYDQLRGYLRNGSQNAAPLYSITLTNKKLSYNNKAWILPQTLPEEGVEGLAGYPRLIRQVLYNRGYRDAQTVQEFLHGQGDMLDPFLLSDMGKAVERIRAGIANHEKMVVYGDFDVDGISGTALLCQALAEVGAQVTPYIPDRFAEGYGLNPDAMRSIAGEGTQLLLTVDCGIRSLAEVGLAQQLGMDVILTDHHLPGQDIPPAYAVICQKKDEERYPNRHIAGVGLAYKLMLALFRQMEKSSADIEKYLDLVALGTVADVVPLVGENRALVKKGLAVIHQGERVGLLALELVSDIINQEIYKEKKIRVPDPTLVNAEHIGFRLGPRLNAAGRLDSALLGWKLLTTRDESEAAELAARLNVLNGERQEKTEAAYQTASAQVDVEREGRGEEIIFAVNEAFHEGIVGLVASKLTEEHYRPAIVGTAHNGLIRASCRSVEEFHITHALDACRELLVQYGGHSMAAGFSVERQNLQALEEKLLQIARAEVNWEDANPKLELDGQVNAAELNGQIPAIMRGLALFEPTGEGNRKPLLYGQGLRVQEKRLVGKNQNHLKLKLKEGFVMWDAIAFGMGNIIHDLADTVDIAFYYDINDFNGGIQLMVRDIRAGTD